MSHSQCTRQWHIVSRLIQRFLYYPSSLAKRRVLAGSFFWRRAAADEDDAKRVAAERKHAPTKTMMLFGMIIIVIRLASLPNERRFEGGCGDRHLLDTPEMKP
jgi:hypothetical protein